MKRIVLTLMLALGLLATASAQSGQDFATRFVALHKTEYPDMICGTVSPNMMERIMLDIMFKLPSLPDVKGCLINQAVIEKGKEPVLLYADDGDFPAEALEDQTV